MSRQNMQPKWYRLIRLVGEFRVHYAGFFDPGFGHSSSGWNSAPKGVLEVRSHKVPFILEDGQIIGHLIYEHLSEATTPALWQLI